MPKAFRVKRYDHVTPAKRMRLLEESLVPILDEPTQDSLDIQNYLQKGDWLIEYNESSELFYLYRVKSYRHEPRLHLYIKHFIKADFIYELESAQLSDDSRTLLTSANHLEVLPVQLFDMADSYNDRINTDLDERFKQLIFKLKLRRNILPAFGRNVLRELEGGRLGHSRFKEALINLSPDLIKNVREKMPDVTDAEWEEKLPILYSAQWEAREKALFKFSDVSDKVHEPYPTKEFVDPDEVTGAISKAALETYMKNHDGKLPTVKEFENLTKRFTSSGTRRRRH